MNDKLSALGSRLGELGSTRYREYVTRATHGILDSEAETPKQLRWAVFHHRTEEIPAELQTYVAKVRDHAYKVTDEDIESLRRAGYSEDAVFEITAAAAMGAAIMRLERGLIALNESTP